MVLLSSPRISWASTLSEAVRKISQHTGYGESKGGVQPLAFWLEDEDCDGEDDGDGGGDGGARGGRGLRYAENSSLHFLIQPHLMLQDNGSHLEIWKLRLSKVT